MKIDASTREQPEPGVYEGVPSAHYHGWPAASSSKLKIALRRSFAHLRYSIDNPDPSTPAMEFGSVAHHALLEPDTFDRWHTEKPPGRKGGKAHDAAVAEILAERPWATLVKPDDRELAFRMRDAVLAHPTTGPLFRAEGAELSLVWDDPDTGVRCKARVDKPTEFGPADYKTTGDASAEPFGRDAYTYGYYLQAALYLRGCSTLGLPAEQFLIAACEKPEPHGIGVYAVPHEWIVRGEYELDDVLAKYARCLESEQWPSYPSGVGNLELPGWAAKRIDEDLMMEAI